MAARRIGAETPNYVSNIYKYYLAYKMTIEQDARRQASRSARVPSQPDSRNIFSQSTLESHPPKRGSSVQFLRRNHDSRKIHFGDVLLTAPAAWAQFSKADMIKLATDRFDTAAKTLNLSRIR
jgi:hypothetical protein